jgi:NTP pyrophosphatase (non-canonical NTP hydrolase)
MLLARWSGEQLERMLTPLLLSETGEVVEPASQRTAYGEGERF